MLCSRAVRRKLLFIETRTTADRCVPPQRAPLDRRWFIKVTTCSSKDGERLTPDEELPPPPKPPGAVGDDESHATAKTNKTGNR